MFSPIWLFPTIHYSPLDWLAQNPYNVLSDSFLLTSGGIESVAVTQNLSGTHVDSSGGGWVNQAFFFF